jgi:hypothetical protein
MANATFTALRLSAEGFLSHHPLRFTAPALLQAASRPRLLA